MHLRRRGIQCRLEEWTTFAPGAAYSIARHHDVRAVREGAELLRDGFVVLTASDDGVPPVVSEKNFMSSRRRHTRSLSRPMTPLLATATMMEIRMPGPKQKPPL